MTVARLCLCLCLCLFAGCDSGSPDTTTGDTAEKELTAMLQSDCEAGRRMLSSLARGERSGPSVYEVAAAASTLCWVETGEDAHMTAGRRILETGVARYGESAELRLALGIHSWVFGNSANARDVFSEAVRLAGPPPEDFRTRWVSREAHSFMAGDLEQPIMHAVGAEDCDRAFVLLGLTSPKKRENTLWFEIAYLAHGLCAQQRDDRDLLQAGFEILDEGIESYPSSVRLHAAKGFGMEVEKPQDALTALRAARDGLAAIPEYERTRFTDEQFQDFKVGLQRKIADLEKETNLPPGY